METSLSIDDDDGNVMRGNVAFVITGFGVGWSEVVVVAGTDGSVVVSSSAASVLVSSSSATDVSGESGVVPGSTSSGVVSSSLGLDVIGPEPCAVDSTFNVEDISDSPDPNESRLLSTTFSSLSRSSFMPLSPLSSIAWVSSF